jgi:hypothetical protein
MKQTNNRIIQIDHFPDSDRYIPHESGTFCQRYFFDATYYKPGGPVLLYIGGETSGPSRFPNMETGSEWFSRIFYSTAIALT